MAKAVASASQGQDGGVVQEAVEDGSGAGHIAQELAPIFERSIGGHYG